MATLGLSEADRTALDAFKRDVVDPSMTSLVIAYFTAAWCGPCKQLGPILDKVAADYAGKGVLLHRIDVDQNKPIAAQFRVQSIPTVYAVFQGQLVADLTPARTESALGKTLDQILAQLPVQGEAQSLEAEIEPLITMGEEVLASGDAPRALSIFQQLFDMAADASEEVQGKVVSGLARASVAAGLVEEARDLLASLPDAVARLPAVARAKAAVELASVAAPETETSRLDARVAADPDDHEARYELAGALMASDRDRAADLLLESIARDREWNDGAARKRLLQLMEVVGITDPWVSTLRRRLSAVLFT